MSLDFNNVLIGTVIISLLGYGLYLIRRMYKNRIRILEKDVIEMRELIKTQEKDLQSYKNKDFNIIRDDSSELEDDLNEMAVELSRNQKEDKIEPKSDDDNSNLKSTNKVMVDIDDENIFVADDKKSFDISKNKLEDKDNSEDFNDNVTDIIEKDDENSSYSENINLSCLTINQLRKKLNDLGEDVPKSLKKKDLIQIINNIQLKKPTTEQSCEL